MTNQPPDSPDSGAPAALGESVRVFLSYSHDSPEHAARVLDLAHRLREHGIDARIDQYQPHPPEGWPKWMHHQIRDAAFVLVVCTPTFRRRFEGDEVPGKGHGATWEGSLVTLDLYEHASHNERFIPVVFEDNPNDVIPTVLRSYTHYRLLGDWDRLYRRLTGQPEIVMPALGVVRPMPPRNPGAVPATPSTTPAAAAASAADDEARRDALHGLLLSLFDAGGLRRFVAYGPKGNAITAEDMPGDSASLAATATAVVASWARRGLVNADLFARLDDKFPGRAADIARVRRLWLP